MQRTPTTLVLGGGIAGLTAALNLARRGTRVTLVERHSELGGNAATVSCKAIDGQCQLCGGCLLYDRLAAVKRSDAIEIRTQTTVARMQRARGGFSVWLSPEAEPSIPLSVEALLVATGFDHIDARSKGPYGYGSIPAVITGQDLERRLRLEGQNAFAGRALQKVAFVQCVGSRDEQAGRGYCSQVCCRYGLRLARLLKHQQPQAEITIFKMDIQTSGRDFAAIWEAAPNEGIRLVSGLPAVIRRSTTNPERASFHYDDILAGQTARDEFDLVVLATGMQPRRDAGALAAMLGLNRDRYGFAATLADECSTIVPGIFVAGSCQAPRSLAESVAHAQRAAGACYAYLQEQGL